MMATTHQPPGRSRQQQTLDQHRGKRDEEM
jgi:hypothetical protein